MNGPFQMLQQLSLKTLTKRPKRAAYFDFSDLWRKGYVLVALQQNHGDLILFPLMSRYQGLTANPPLSVLLVVLYLLQ